jgi:hypothetical protein
MLELSKRIDEIHTISLMGLQIRNEKGYNQTNPFEPSQRETYRTFEDDERSIGQAYRKIIGPSPDQMIAQLPTFDRNPRKLIAFCSNIRKTLSLLVEEYEPYFYMYLQNKIIREEVGSYYKLKCNIK